MLSLHLAQQALRTVQIALPAILLALLLLAFFRPSARARAQQEADQQLPGVVPVILAVARPRTRLVATLVALLGATYLISLILLLVFQHGHPPVISLWTAGTGLVAWSSAAALLWETRDRAPATGALWVKGMLWVGLLGESLMGALRVHIFVDSTSTLPQTVFPLPFFAHFTLLSVRLLHFVLALWAITSPRREFVSAAAAGGGRRSSARSESEREGLLGGVEESAVGGDGEGYGTFLAQDQGTNGSGSSTPRAAESRSVSTKSVKSVPLASSSASVSASQTAPVESAVEAQQEERPFSYADAVKHDVHSSTSAAAELSETSALEVPISTSSNILDITISPADDRSSSGPHSLRVANATSKTSTPPTPASPIPTSIPLPLTTSTAPTPIDSPKPSTPAALPIATPASTATDAQPLVPFPSASSRASTEFSRTSSGADAADKEKRKRIHSLSDMGRRVSDEGKTFVRKMSLLKRGKSSSGQSSPVSGSIERFDGAEGGSSSPKLDGMASPTLQKRFSLLSRNLGSSAPPSPTVEASPLVSGGPEDAALAATAQAGRKGSAGGSGGGGKKGKGGQKGRNGKGKKVSKFPNAGGKRSPH